MAPCAFIVKEFLTSWVLVRQRSVSLVREVRYLQELLA